MATLTKTAMGVMFILAMLTGFLLFTNDVRVNYDVQNDTGYLGELDDAVTENTDEMSDIGQNITTNLKEIPSINFIGATSGLLLNVIKLPFTFIDMITDFVSVVFGILPIHDKVNAFLVIMITLIVAFTILKVMLGRGGEV